ncbi:MAG: hypothetical protein ACN4GW_02930 [Desulforhopalus sp.]
MKKMLFTAYSWLDSCILSPEIEPIMACSALKIKYCLQLGRDLQTVYFVYLKENRDLLEQRLDSRTHRYMNNELLQSQLETLEEPGSGLTVDINDNPNALVENIIKELKPRSQKEQ